MAGARANDEMDVVGHHTPGTEIVTFSVEVSDGVGNDFGNLWVTHVAVAASLVECGFDVVAVELLKLFFEVADLGGLVVFADFGDVGL